MPHVLAPLRCRPLNGDLDPWAGRGVWLETELHTHTRFTDGGHTVEDVVAAAARNGCDVVAITDHGDGDLKGATPEYLDAIRAARAANPGITVIGGMEWNVPPGKGQEHANILFPAAMENIEVLAPFKERFDDQVKEGGIYRARPCWIRRTDPKGSYSAGTRRDRQPPEPATLVYECAVPHVRGIEESRPWHPHRVRRCTSHQRGAPLGSYAPGILMDRWDPLAAQIDGAWDQWLRKGLQVWAAIATADFHGEQDDFWPCEFGATRIYAPIAPPTESFVRCTPGASSRSMGTS